MPSDIDGCSRLRAAHRGREIEGKGALFAGLFRPTYMGIYVPLEMSKIRNGTMDKQSLDLLLAQGLGVEKIARRVGEQPGTVSYWMTWHGLPVANREKHAPRGGIARDRLMDFVEAQMSIAAIAREVGVSKTTVRYWLRRYGLQTEAARRLEHRRRARQSGLTTLPLICARHGRTDFVIEGRGYYRCKRCRADRVARRRRKLKTILVAEAGGACRVCGYDRCIAALEFHHVNRDEKKLAISNYGVTLSLEVLRAEASKCVLLCSNCHVEVETGFTSLPAKVPEGVRIGSTP